MYKNLSKKKYRGAKISLSLTLLSNPWLEYGVKSLYPFVTSWIAVQFIFANLLFFIKKLQDIVLRILEINQCSLKI